MTWRATTRWSQERLFCVVSPSVTAETVQIEQMGSQYLNTCQFQPGQFSTTEVWYLIVRKCNFPIRNILKILNSTYFSQCLQRNVMRFSILTWWWKIGSFALWIIVSQVLHRSVGLYRTFTLFFCTVRCTVMIAVLPNIILFLKNHYLSV